MNYEAWRITYQSSEQAARAAFEMLSDLGGDIGFRARLIGRIKSERDAFRAELDALKKQKPIAWADDKAFSGGVGNVASAAAKAYWEKSNWADRESAKRLRHPLYALAPVPQAPSVPDGWINPNDKTQRQYLPHIGQPVLFCHGGTTYYGKHTGGSFTTGQGVTARNFITWDCLWMPLPAAPQPERSE